MPNQRHIIQTYIFRGGVVVMKRILMAVMAVAVAVTFSAPAFAEEKKEPKKPKGDQVVVYGDKKNQDGGKADDAFGDKKEKPGQ